ncbi:MAG: hypothetical protein PWP07_197 [Epulopiscium sp.]|uniref:WD40 repeat domain-containing protein n=1 Tax=Defluviitalea raffinosedens TaxID=1450156 RepID=A0A7C8LG11_9FIRM|nr:DUF5711 family protein [Defluviitalea raffinosedens]MBZ4668764.1 hypothetical protein [Defluviitaleaceae bacterium]MDK2786972.1 hypothetical protein [Candidatus Epulonipiscium sp.]KAE9627756.1 hypothetical protein GND95_14560 [Defluviitalea raffinosedens]MBM7685999.1 hypothetical protein [Defluviitalea raffinosedens]HHW67755.1 hypothetical protein [Candidatus Epulonipiscium sp.]
MSRIEAYKNKKDKRAQIFSLILLMIASGILIYSEVAGKDLHLSFFNGNEPSLYLEKQWVKRELSDRYTFNVYGNDLIQCGPDGVKRISQNGDEIWNQTFSMNLPKLIVNEPYLAVGEDGGKKIYVLNDKGLVYQVTTQNPIEYFSINSKGYLSVIGATKDGHRIKVYDAQGKDLGIDRNTFIEDAGYPLSAIVSDNGYHMPVSYLNPDTKGLKSNLIFLDLGENGILKEDLIEFAIEKEDTIFPGMFYLQNNTLVVLGDDRILWIDEDNNVKEEILSNHIKAIPWNIENRRNLSTYLVLALGEEFPGKQGEKYGSVVFYSTEGSKKHVFDPEGDVTYLYGDDNMVIVGVNRTFYGLDPKGKEIFKYTALKDVDEMIPLKNGNKVALVSKDSVDLMEIKR